MSVKVQDFLNNEKLPKFIVDHPVLKSIDKIDKAFPKLGLVNCKQLVSIDNSELAKQSAYNLLASLYTIFSSQRMFLDNKARDPMVFPQKLPKIKSWYNTIVGVERQINRGYDTLIHSSNGKITLKLSDDINTDFKKHESLFRVYNKIYEGIKSLRIGAKISKLDTIPTFKEFSSDNVPSKKMYIVFSSDGLDGLWDIATMSMRGIKSCQSWTSRSKYKTNIIGSIVDPFTGVIYLTTGKDVNHLGSKMINRCVVRLVVDKTTRKPSIVVDRMYPVWNNNVANLFDDFIRRKTDNKLDVILAPNSVYGKLNNVYCPHSKVHDKLTKTTKSYMDTKQIEVASKKSDNQPSQEITAKQTMFRNMISGFVIRAYNQDMTFRQLKEMRDISKSKDIQDALFKVITSADFKYLSEHYYGDIAKFTVANTSIHLSPDDYMKQLLFQFLANKHTKKPMTAFVRSINHYFGFAKKSRLDSKIVHKLLVSLTIQDQVAKSIKHRLRSLITPIASK